MVIFLKFWSNYGYKKTLDFNNCHFWYNFWPIYIPSKKKGCMSRHWPKNWTGNWATKLGLLFTSMEFQKGHENGEGVGGTKILAWGWRKT
jgi:hypothetical protein